MNTYLLKTRESLQFNGNDTTIALQGKVYFYCFCGKKPADLFGPFDEAMCIGIKIILITHIISLAFGFDAVKIEMVYFSAGSGTVLIYERKGRAADGIFHAQRLTDGFDKGCFPGAHRTRKCKDLPVAAEP